MTLQWGILGCGNIAGQFATGLQVLSDAKLVAVGSRTQEKADAFGEKFGAKNRHASYEALANDPEVQAIYIATPHSLHAEDALLCLGAGKAVLCEKPFTINAKEAQTVVSFAREKNIFLMEAMWTRFFPIMYKLRELLTSGAIGDPRLVQADFGFRAGVDPKGRLFNPELGGGALLDVGVYTISLASMIFGTPTQIAGVTHLGETGVDEESGMLFGYRSGQLAVLSTAIRTNTPHEATIVGTDGTIKIQSPWWRPSAMTLSAGGKEAKIELLYAGNGYQFQAQEVASCLAAGKTESEIIPLDETLAIMQTMDTLRAQWGLKYPME